MFMATHGLPAQEAVSMANDALSFCREHGLVLFEHWIRFNQGALLARQGQVAAGVEVMELAIAAAEALQSFQFRPFQMSCIGAAYLHLGEPTRALGLLDNAIALAQTGGERQSFPALHRIRAQILIRLGRGEEGWDMLQAALSMARQQHARLEMLRIATAMLTQAAVDHPDEEQETRNSLREIIALFEEGHDLPELRASRELLAAHGQSDAATEV